MGFYGYDRILGRRSVGDMRCRRTKRENDVNNVVWFGSYGKNADGTAKFYNDSDKHDNFSEEQESVKDSLTQRLSVIENELWYAINYGLPLIGNASRVEMDAAIITIIDGHPDVSEITSFESEFIGHSYHAKIEIQSAYGVINISI